MTSILLYLKLPSFKTVMHNATVTAAIADEQWCYTVGLLKSASFIVFLYFL